MLSSSLMVHFILVEHFSLFKMTKSWANSFPEWNSLLRDQRNTESNLQWFVHFRNVSVTNRPKLSMAGLFKTTRNGRRNGFGRFGMERWRNDDKTVTETFQKRRILEKLVNNYAFSISWMTIMVRIGSFLELFRFTKMIIFIG